ncbi:MAG: class I SAM-dependent methyltransferase [Thermoleophilia bacterium]|nr:class I SAM-dependent methyltransferase [Thermoleophilia bacterium]
MLIDPDRIVVSTVFENRPPYTAEVEILYRTLAANGGALARARRIACCVGPVDPFVAGVLADLDVEVREVEPFDERCPHANKLAMLQLADEGELVLALDTDVAIAGDPTPWLSPTAIQAKIADGPPFLAEHWPALFDARGVAIPQARYLTDHEYNEIPPYFNSGVLAVPSELCGILHAEWADTILWLLDTYPELPPEIRQVSFFTDQFAFMLAVARLQLPIRALPLALNYPTHELLHVASGADSCDPVIIHHHHRLHRDGQLIVGPHPAGHAAIERINAELRREPDAAVDASASTAAGDDASGVRAGQAPFDNESFWNERYLTNPELGSGIGSRGEIAERKRALLQGVIDEITPASMLDVGCGDLEIVGRLALADATYTGIDIAQVVLERNARRHPDWTFLHGDFVTIADSRDVAADLVVCMDVLIHQHDPDYYRSFVHALVAATRHTGIIAAYDRPPSAANASDITAWHGSITELLRACGARDVQVVDEYRETSVVRFTPPA